MIKTIVFALFGLALASAAQAMPFSPAYQPDGMITQARMGCGAGMVMVNGACVARTTIAMRADVRDGMVASALTTTECPVISFKGESDMRKIALTGAIIV